MKYMLLLLLLPTFAAARQIGPSGPVECELYATYCQKAAAFPAAPQPGSHPYFRVLDWQHPHFNVGAAFDPSDPKQSEATTLLPLITHSHADGYLLIPGEDWSPLAVGGGLRAGTYAFDVTPLFNVLPSFTGGLAKALDLLAPNSYANLKSLLAATPSSATDAGFSVGPMWEYKPTVCKNGKGFFRLFLGAWLKF